MTATIWRGDAEIRTNLPFVDTFPGDLMDYHLELDS